MSPEEVDKMKSAFARPRASDAEVAFRKPVKGQKSKNQASVQNRAQKSRKVQPPLTGEEDEPKDKVDPLGPGELKEPQNTTSSDKEPIITVASTEKNAEEIKQKNKVELMQKLLLSQEEVDAIPDAGLWPLLKLVRRARAVLTPEEYYTAINDRDISGSLQELVNERDPKDEIHAGKESDVRVDVDKLVKEVVSWGIAEDKVSKKASELDKKEFLRKAYQEAQDIIDEARVTLDEQEWSQAMQSAAPLREMRRMTKEKEGELVLLKKRGANIGLSNSDLKNKSRSEIQKSLDDFLIRLVKLRDEVGEIDKRVTDEQITSLLDDPRALEKVKDLRAKRDVFSVSAIDQPAAVVANEPIVDKEKYIAERRKLVDQVLNADIVFPVEFNTLSIDEIQAGLDKYLANLIKLRNAGQIDKSITDEQLKSLLDDPNCVEKVEALKTGRKVFATPQAQSVPATPNTAPGSPDVLKANRAILERHARNTDIMSRAEFNAMSDEEVQRRLDDFLLDLFILRDNDQIDKRITNGQLEGLLDDPQAKVKFAKLRAGENVFGIFEIKPVTEESRANLDPDEQRQWAERHGITPPKSNKPYDRTLDVGLDPSQIAQKRGWAENSATQRKLTRVKGEIRPEPSPHPRLDPQVRALEDDLRTTDKDWDAYIEQNPEKAAVYASRQREGYLERALLRKQMRDALNAEPKTDAGTELRKMERDLAARNVGFVASSALTIDQNMAAARMLNLALDIHHTPNIWVRPAGENEVCPDRIINFNFQASAQEIADFLASARQGSPDARPSRNAEPTEPTPAVEPEPQPDPQAETRAREEAERQAREEEEARARRDAEEESQREAARVHAINERLDRARDRLAIAERAYRGFGKLNTFNNPTEAARLEVEFLNATQEFQEAQAYYMAERFENYRDEERNIAREHLVVHIEGRSTIERVSERLTAWNRALGKWNVYDTMVNNGADVSQMPRWRQILYKNVLNARTAMNFSLLGLGWLVGTASAVGGGVILVRRMISGASTATGTYDTLKAAREGHSNRAAEQYLNNNSREGSVSELEGHIAAMESRAVADGNIDRLNDNPLYKRLMDRYDENQRMHFEHYADATPEEKMALIKNLLERSRRTRESKIRGERRYRMWSRFFAVAAGAVMSGAAGRLWNMAGSGSTPVEAAGILPRVPNAPELPTNHYGPPSPDEVAARLNETSPAPAPDNILRTQPLTDRTGAVDTRNVRYTSPDLDAPDTTTTRSLPVQPENSGNVPTVPTEHVEIAPEPELAEPQDLEPVTPDGVEPTSTSPEATTSPAEDFSDVDYKDQQAQELQEAREAAAGSVSKTSHALKLVLGANQFDGFMKELDISSKELDNIKNITFKEFQQSFDISKDFQKDYRGLAEFLSKHEIKPEAKIHQTMIELVKQIKHK